MAYRFPRRVVAFPLLLVLASCGDQSLFMSPKTGTADLQIVSAADGQVYAGGKTVPLMISAPDNSTSRDVEIEVTLANASGESLYHNRGAATLNEQTPINLPASLATGQYRLDLVLYSGGEVVQKKSVAIFVAPDGWKIDGIRSFPPLITSSSTVMLKAELEIPKDANPYLRWTWKGKVIQKGMLSAGLGQILWDVPGEGGVYTITLELFPSPPAAGADFAFTSSVSLSTDIIVSGQARTRGRLGPPADFLTLLRLQGSLADSGAGARKLGKTTAAAVGSPELVSLENVFGYRLDGSSGIRIPWLALPSDGGNLRPFTISLGVSFDDLAGADSIVKAETRDGGFSLEIGMNPQTLAPEARITSAGALPTVVPWGGPPLAAKDRILLSFSVAQQQTGLSTQWFLDGTQVSSLFVRAEPGGVRQDGSVTIGGEHGFSGVVDEFGVYATDPLGRPATDPALYFRAQSALYGSRLVFADGFDGIALYDGFTIEGGGKLAAGSVDLPPGARLVLPVLRTGEAVTVSAALSSSSGRSASLVVQTESGSPLVVVPVTVGASGLGFRLAADSRSLSVSTADVEKNVAIPPADGSGSGLIVKIADPADAKSDLVIESVLALKQGQ
jgi:hypothetical protein